MKERCYNKNHKDYRYYGKKGIGIFEGWLSDPSLFEQWAFSNGYSDTLTIDRLDASKDYSPLNCRWIPLKENTRRAGKVNWLTVDGKTMTGKEWSAYFGLGVNTINRLIRESGEANTELLIQRMLQMPPHLVKRKPRQTWFSAYGIAVDDHSNNLKQ